MVYLSLSINLKNVIFRVKVIIINQYKFTMIIISQNYSIYYMRLISYNYSIYYRKFISYNVLNRLYSEIIYIVNFMFNCNYRDYYTLII